MPASTRSALLAAILLLLLISGCNDPRMKSAPSVDASTLAAPWFTNIAEEAGLGEAEGAPVTLADLNHDGWWDIVINKRQAFLNQHGRTFAPHDTGIEYPIYKHIPLTPEGKPDTDKAADKEFLPQYLYFADLDNDGDMDAVQGVHSYWQYFDEAKQEFVTVQECDPGLRTTFWINDGKGHFKKESEAIPLAKAALGPGAGPAAGNYWAPTAALAILDYDNDGCLDIYEGCEYRVYGVLEDCGVDRLWRADDRYRFAYEDVTEAAGLLTSPVPGQPNSSRPSYGVTHGDMNNDGLQDLLQMAYGRQWNYQWRNNGDGTFTDVSFDTHFAGDDISHGEYPYWVKRNAELPFRSNGNTFDCAIIDFDNDGDLDCFLGEIRHEWAGDSSDDSSLLINLGEADGWAFQRVPVGDFLPPRPGREGMRWNHGDLHCAWIDVDNDMLPDLLIGSGDYPDGQFLRLYRQKPDHSFEEATDLAGFHWEGCGALSVGDVDRDGDQDILAGRSFTRLSQDHRDTYMDGIRSAAPALFRNDVANATGNHWLNVRLIGGGKGEANRQAVGARVYVTAGGVTQMRELRCGSGLGNHQDPPEAHFGLAAHDRVDKLVVVWPDKARSRQEFFNLRSDCFITVLQGNDRPRIENPSPPADSGRQ